MHCLLLLIKQVQLGPMDVLARAPCCVCGCWQGGGAKELSIDGVKRTRPDGRVTREGGVTLNLLPKVLNVPERLYVAYNCTGNRKDIKVICPGASCPCGSGVWCGMVCCVSCTLLYDPVRRMRWCVVMCGGGW